MNHKLICFDLDGTIIDETIFIWQTLHDALGTDKKKRQQAIDDYMAKRITYDEWAQHDLGLWQDVNATREQMKKAIAPLRLMDGALDVLNELKKRGIKMAVISGSVDLALEHVLPNYEDYFDHVYINKIVFEDNKPVDIIATKHDFEHKATAMKEICQKENIHIKETIFVGDHDNDIHIAEAAGLSIAFNCKSDRLAQIADHLVTKKDLREILPFIK